MSETPELPPLPSPAATLHAGGDDIELFVPKQMREQWEAGRRAGLEEAARLTPVAPWPDFAGQPIHHGDRLRHPTGDEFIAVRLHGYAEESDAWRAIYDGESGPSRLGLQIGDKGRAVLIRAACGGTGRAKP